MGSNKNEVVFDLDAAAFSSDEFRIYQFKVRAGGFLFGKLQACETYLRRPVRTQVKRCPRARPHDWTQVGPYKPSDLTSQTRSLRLRVTPFALTTACSAPSRILEKRQKDVALNATATRAQPAQNSGG